MEENAIKFPKVEVNAPIESPSKANEPMAPDDPEIVGKILILKSSKKICSYEMGALEYFCKLVGLEVYNENILNEGSIEFIATKYAGEQIEFDFIYLCAHGSKEGFETDMGDEVMKISWTTFSELVCENAILKENTVFLLSCCQGGLLQVAIDIMVCCNKINYVCGVKWTVQNWDLTTGFIVFMHNLINKHTEPSTAAKRASLATDYTFVCNERDEIESLPQYTNRQNFLYQTFDWIDEQGNTITNNPKILENTGLQSPTAELTVDLNEDEKFEGVNAK